MFILNNSGCNTSPICKMVWYICTIPPELILIGHGLPFHSLCKAQLGTKYGGLGLCSSKAHAAAAYLSSFLTSNLLAGQFLGKIFNPLTFFPAYPVLTL